MKRIISFFAAVAAILSAFSCQRLEPTSLNADTLPVKVEVAGHARYIAVGKSGANLSPEIVDRGTPVHIFYGVKNAEGKLEYALKTVKTDDNGFFSAEIGCPVGKTMSVKVNCSMLGESYAYSDGGKFVSTDTWFFGEVSKASPSRIDIPTLQKLLSYEKDIVNSTPPGRRSDGICPGETEILCSPEGGLVGRYHLQSCNYGKGHPYAAQAGRVCRGLD